MSQWLLGKNRLEVMEVYIYFEICSTLQPARDSYSMLTIGAAEANCKLFDDVRALETVSLIAAPNTAKAMSGKEIPHSDGRYEAQLC